jgi:CheY-like chemotaxis protein
LNAREALKKAREVNPDAVVLDIMMPEIDGWEVCRKLKEDPETKDLPVIILSVRAEEKDKSISFNYAGAEWHVSTPFDTDHLFLILELATKKHDDLKN